MKPIAPNALRDGVARGAKASELWLSSESRPCLFLKMLATSTLLVSSLFAFAPAPQARYHIGPQSAVNRPAAQVLQRAIDLSANYLERTCGVSGKFIYQVDSDSGRLSSSYNIVRHAGAIYALAMYNRTHPGHVEAMIRASSYMRVNYISPDAVSHALVVWSKPVPIKSEAALGAAGLGLAALTATEQARSGTVPLNELRGIARFIAFLQRPDGSFSSKYDAESGPAGDWESLYYPGEAALGLVSLYEMDHSIEWLNGAGKALSYLARRRAQMRVLPPDHWALIATARFLPYYDPNICPAARGELVAHAARICDTFLRQQIRNSQDARLNGGFDANGRTTPAAIRVEGLLAALEFLPDDAMGLRTRVETAVQGGIAFLLRAQIPSGPYVGGMPESVLKTDSFAAKADPHASEVRVDYVQHALCAWLRYQKALKSLGNKAPGQR